MSNVEDLIKEADRVSRDLSELREKIKQLKEKKTSLYAEISKLTTERARLLNEIRSLKNQIRAIKEERVKLIEDYRKTQNERKEELSQLEALRELLSNRVTELEGLSREIKIPISALRQKIEEIEWTIQTNILTPDRENELIRKIKAYNQLLNKALLVEERREEVLELRATYLSLRTRIKELSNKLREMRGIIDEKTKVLREYKLKLDAVVKKYLDIKESIEAKRKELEQCNSEIALKTSQSIALREKYQQLIDAIEKAKARGVLNEKKLKVSKDLEKRSKKRLTIEELKIMYGELEDLEED
ncbi:MAG: ATP-binding protein [Desulfurococcaceae archaeon]